MSPSLKRLVAIFFVTFDTSEPGPLPSAEETTDTLMSVPGAKFV
jgi:hypothetical protein